jgi:HlyD family secretion protein
VQIGHRASFTVEAFPGRRFQGSVAQVRQAPQTVQNVVTYDVVVNVANPDFLLKPGMTATTRIITDERANVVRVPDQALRYAPGGLAAMAGAPPATGEKAAAPVQVWVLRDGRPMAVAVTLGLDDDTYSEIVQGELAPGDQIILSEQRTGSGPTVAAPRL